jgi:hypothetical protein
VGGKAGFELFVSGHGHSDEAPACLPRRPTESLNLPARPRLVQRRSGRHDSWG